MIREATPADAAAIAEITNFYVRASTTTFYTEELSVESRREWLTGRAAHHPVFVLEIDGIVLGWAALSEYKARPAYRHTVESSVYLRDGQQRRGLGRALMEHVLAAARAHGFHVVVAGMCAESAGSIALHRSLGFVEVARFRQVGWKFGRWLDVVYLQLMLDPAAPPATGP